ncbi:MAG: FAD-dependent oxidoreductase, partial [Ruminococcaceae bacterium]|nr:FAD-dependent oxidoreductase [Oscillospiraceae bacterium]
LGLRETVHFVTRFRAEEMPLLTGVRYDAPILNGTYPVDIHHHEDGGISFKHLDGRRHTTWGKNTRHESGNWREEMGLTGDPAKYYQLPFDLLVGEEYKNFIAAGRMVNADPGAYGAIRVMVNLNQLGEAAGTAAALCLERGESLQTIDGKLVSETLRKGGSAV